MKKIIYIVSFVALSYVAYNVFVSFNSVNEMTETVKNSLKESNK